MRLKACVGSRLHVTADLSAQSSKLCRLERESGDFRGCECTEPLESLMPHLLLPICLRESRVDLRALKHRTALCLEHPIRNNLPHRSGMPSAIQGWNGQVTGSPVRDGSPKRKARSPTDASVEDDQSVSMHDLRDLAAGLA